MTDPDTISLLLRSAGHRAPPPSETAEAVYLGARVAWRQAVRRRRLRFTLAAAAAVACLAVGVAWWAASVRSMGVSAGTIAAASDCAHLAAGATIAVGDVLDLPAPCLLAFETSEGRRLRLAGGSRAWFTDEHTLRLAQGRSYFDSGQLAEDAPAFTLDTPYGQVTHAGTQFIVEVSPENLTVMVRSGAARIATPAMRIGAGRGEAVRIGTDGRELARWPVATSGDAWAWADSLAPALELEGRSLAEVLAEIARESGRLVHYENEDVRALCRATRLHGPALALPADRMLDAVLASTELDAHIEGDRLLIGRRAMQ